MLKQGEMLTLDDNKKYSVVWTVNSNNKNYVYLIEQDDLTNTMFCEYDDNDNLEEVVDPEIIEELMSKFKHEVEGN